MYTRTGWSKGEGGGAVIIILLSHRDGLAIGIGHLHRHQIVFLTLILSLPANIDKKGNSEGVDAYTSLTSCAE